MRLLIAAAVLSLTAAPSLADDIALSSHVPFHELRHLDAAGGVESIDDAIAGLPSSRMNGTLNRISALLARPGVRDLEAGEGLDGGLPASFEGQMADALLDLRLDVKFGFFAEDGSRVLSLEQELTILQVIDVVAFGRNLELLDGWDDVTCVPTVEHPCPPDPRPVVVQELDQLAATLRGSLADMISVYNVDRLLVTPVPPPEPVDLSPVRSSSFDARLDRVRATFLTIRGVESIDD